MFYIKQSDMDELEKLDGFDEIEKAIRDLHQKGQVIQLNPSGKSNLAFLYGEKLKKDGYVPVHLDLG